MVRIIAVTTASVLSLALASAAVAQDAPSKPAADEKASDEIIITATRQATNLQETPIAITAVTSEALENRGITNIGELTSQVPNAQFRRVQGAFGPGVSAFVRGLGSGDTSLAGQPPVSFYLDDVYYPILLGANFDLLDMDHIEVLRGPQGTLFGRNSLGGALNIVAKQPSTAGASGYAEVTTGSYNRLDVRAGFNYPLSDTAAIMVSGMAKKREGYQRQLDFTCEMARRGTPALAGTFPLTTPLQSTTKFDNVTDCTIGHYGGEDVKGGRASFMWNVTPSVKLTVTGDYLRDLSENPADSVVDIDVTKVSPSLTTPGPINLRTQAAYFGVQIDSRFMTGDPYTTYASYNDRIAAGTVIAGNTYYNGSKNERGTPTRGGYILPNHNDLKNWGIAGKLNIDLGGNIGLTAVFAHRDLDETHTFDTDGTPLVVEHVINHLIEIYDHAELRISGKSDLIDWVGGAFYYRANGDQHASLQQVYSAGQRQLHTTYSPLSKAVFANATIRPFGEKLGIQLGGRWSDEIFRVNFSNIADTSWQNAGSDITFLQTLSSKKFSWKAGASYQVDRNMLFYASASTGYTLPSYNTRPLQKTQIEQSDAAEDIAYEIGAKLDLFDRKLRLNVAAFYTDFKNRPTTIAGGAEPTLGPTGSPVAGNQQLEPLPGGPAGSTRCAAATLPSNTGIVCFSRSYFRNQPATVRGIEAEYTFTPIPNLVINGSVGWSKFWAPDLEARTVNRRQSNPFWTASGGIQYKIETPALGGSITPRLDWTFESNQIVSGTSTKYNYLMPHRNLFNARLTYENTDHDFTLAGGIVNLFNKFYYINVFDYQTLGYPQTDAQPAMPRTFSVTLSKRF